MRNILIALTLLAAAASCTDETPATEVQSYFEKAVQGIKAAYTGTYRNADNVPQETQFAIDSQAHVVFAELPMDGIMAKLYPREYQGIKATASRYDDPIAVFTVDATQRYFAFRTDFAARQRVDFSFTHDGEQHSGYAMVGAEVNHDATTGLVVVTLEVSDLIVDTADRHSLCPIRTEITAARR